MTRLQPLVFISLLALSLPAIAQDNPSIPLLTSGEVAQLEAGEVLVHLEDDYVIEASVIGVVDARPQQVADYLERGGRLGELVAAGAESWSAGREGSFRLQSGALDTPWPLDDRTWTIRTWSGFTHVDGERVWLSHWDYVPGSGNLVECYGHWLVMPWGTDQSLVQMAVTVDLGTWLPQRVASWATGEFLPGLIRGLRAQLTSSS